MTSTREIQEIKNPKVYFNIIENSCLEQTTSNDAKESLKKIKDENMSHTIGLFRRYLHERAPFSIGKTNEEESQTINRKSPSNNRPLIPPRFDPNPRFPSFLEQTILPEFKNKVEFQTLPNQKSPTAQLTIFYSGAISVYDNVPVDKAHAIMLLAGESSLSAPTVTYIPKSDVEKTFQRSNIQSICKLQAEIPIARKHSLQRFLQKRRDRATDKSPYAPPSTVSTQQETEGSTAQEGSDQRRNFSHSPFPSRSGFFFPCTSS